MEWQTGNGDLSNFHNVGMASTSNNPWLDATPSTSLAYRGPGCREAGKAVNGRMDSTSKILLPSSQQSPLPAQQDDLIQEATRPSLSRLTSSSGLLHGLDRLSLLGSSSNLLGNASTESLSTREDAFSGQRRSLDELRRLRVKGKGRSRAASVESANGVDLGWSSLQNDGRDAILHMVEKGDTLAGIALLYGCTTQAIRTANKLWLNDPIQLRKTLYVPLDACTQPPSKEVEFVQSSSDDVLQMYTNTSESVAPASPARTNGHFRSVSAGRMSSSRSEHSSLDVDRASSSIRPLSRQRADFLSEDLSSIHRPIATVPYLSSTNSDYGDNSDHYGNDSASSAGYQTPPIQPRDLPSTSVSPAPSRVQKTLKIVQIPNSTSKPSKGASLGKSPLISVDNLNSLPDTTSFTSGSATTLLPSLSNDRLSVLAAGSSPNLRLRPRSPMVDAITGQSGTVNTADTPVTLAFAPSPLIEEQDIAPLPIHRSSPQRRGMGKRKSSINRASAPPTPPRISSTSKNVLSAGTGFIASLIGSTTSKQWLGVNGYDEEMQLAREYRNRTASAGHPKTPDRKQPQRQKSSDTLMPIMPNN